MRENPVMTNWENLTMPGLEAWQQKTRTVVLPVGSLEEHGPHLPLGTDTFHALEVARRVAELRPVVIAPPLFYGLCRSTREHPGTVSISGDAWRALLVDLGREFYRQGWRHLVFISGHAGGTHISAMLEAAEGLLAELPEARIAVVNLLELLREVLAAKPELIHTRGDSHAGEVETAIMMAAYPHLVKGSAPEEWPSFPKYVLVRDKRRYWPGGVWGNPAAATAAQGAEILAAEATRLASIINGLEEMEPG
jgi:creatinine amidohydrolase